MDAKRAYRDRADTQVAILDALVDRAEDGMTVFELRTSVDADIDAIETALGALKDDDLIRVDDEGRETVIKPADRVVPEPGEAPPEPSVLDRLRERFPF